MRSNKWITYSLIPALTATGCAIKMPPSDITPIVASQWNAPIPTGEVVATKTSSRFTLTDAGSAAQAQPHEDNGNNTHPDVENIQAWWDNLNDPLLSKLVATAAQNSAEVAAYATTLADAAATLVAARSIRQPSIDAVFTGARSSKQILTNTPVNTSKQYGLQGNMTLDFWGEYKGTEDVAKYRLESATASMFEARVSNAANIASLYYSYFSCKQMLDVARQDLKSIQDTSHLVKLLSKAGFKATADADLASASAAEASARVMNQEVQCALIIKNLASLTAMTETDLIADLHSKKIDFERLPIPEVPAVPGELLAQRPDVLIAELNIKAASLAVGQTEAQRYPKIALSGFIGRSSVSALGYSSNLNVWNVGPLAITMPIFDAGRRRANIGASQARYQQTILNYQAVIRQAINQVETGLINLDNTQKRLNLYKEAIRGYQSNYNATKARFDAGFGSLLELEDSRRLLFTAQSSINSLQRERVVAWVALYQALGGGWLNTRQKEAASTNKPEVLTLGSQRVANSVYTASNNNPDVNSQYVKPKATPPIGSKNNKDIIYPNRTEPEGSNSPAIKQSLKQSVLKTPTTSNTAPKLASSLVSVNTTAQPVQANVIYENRLEPLPTSTTYSVKPTQQSKAPTPAVINMAQPERDAIPVSTPNTAPPVKPITSSPATSRFTLTDAEQGQ